MKYNLLGQKGIEGTINQDAPEAGPYIYDTPPGRGDNKGLSVTSYTDKETGEGSLGPADKKAHNEKLKEAGFEEQKEFDTSNLSFGQKDIPDISKAVQNLSNREFNNINTLSDVKKLSKTRNFSSSQMNILKGQFGLEEINDIFKGEVVRPPADTSSPEGIKRTEFISNLWNFNPVAQLDSETKYIKNFVKNREKIIAEKKANKDTRSLEQKETDYIKKFVEEGILGKVDFKQDPELLIPGANKNTIKSPDYIKQIEDETEYIKDYINDVVTGGVNDNKSSDEIADDLTTGGGQQGGGQQGGGQQGGEQQEGNAGDIYDFLNIPEGAYLWDVDGTNYIVYEVPGSDGELYEGNPIFMAYEVQENDIVKAGIYSPEAPALTGAPVSKVFFDKIAIVTGNTDQLSADIDNPFASFVETIGEQALVAPWIKDPEMISLIAEAAVEGRTVTDAEWQVTNWYQENNETQREWLRTYYSDPSTAAQLTTDAQLAVANSLQASGVSNAPEALINWVAGRYVSGEWSDAYTTEQIALFADPYAQGKRDAQFENYLSSTAITGVDRTTAREREVEELFATWLGPTLGKLTDQEKAEMAGRLRDDPDYKDTLIGSLKQSRLAAFSNYTNPELTYDDIARPWRNLTTSVWGQTADETQGWWQEMVKSNDFATAQTTLREKGLENNITQVTQDATQALTQALGEGLATQGVNQ